jgi:hypothetical protein
MLKTSFLNSHIFAILIFFISIVIGLFVYKDYGIAWDEQWQRKTGLVSYNLIFHGNDSLKTYGNREYGVGFALPLVIIEKILNSKDSREIYLMRHLVTHLFFLLSAFIFYLLICILYKNRILGILGYLILLLTPPIYAHSFFNPKDIPFMSMFIICFFLCEISFQKWKSGYFILFGICTGWLINIRVMGIMFLLFVSAYMIINKLYSIDKKKISKFFLIYIFTALATLIITWPYLWENPLGNFAKAFSTFSNFPQSRLSGSNLIFGEFIEPGKIKWYYIPFWFSVTTPIPVIFAGLVGSIFVIINFIKKPLNFIIDVFSRNQLMYFFCFFGSIVSVIILHSVLYNGWRQMYFIYPSFILLALYCISHILKIVNRHLRSFAYFSVLIIFVYNVFSAGWFMIRNHPFQNVYFNNFLSHKEQYLRKNFDLDYWGTSFKQALEYIVKNNTFYKINVGVENYPGEENVMILKKEDRERIVFVYKAKEADYYISNYRFNPNGFDFPPSRKVFNIKILNSDIISVWKLK